MSPRRVVELAVTRGMARGQAPLLRLIAVCLVAGLLLATRLGFAALGVAAIPAFALALLATFQRVVIVAGVADVWEGLSPRLPNDAATRRELDALAAVVADLPRWGVYPIASEALRLRLIETLPDEGPCLTGHRPLCGHTLPRQRVSPERADLPSLPPASS
ncbi:MAG: hypothetical protein ACTHK1_07570 [Actinomycetales bacterium]